MGGTFKGDRGELGPRLGDLRGSGLTALQRRYVGVGSDGEVMKAKEVMPLPLTATPLSRGPSVSQRRLGAKGGRPRVVGEPWKAAGISRTEYYRRKAKGLV